MRNETIAIHGGYEVEPTTKAVAVPMMQLIARGMRNKEVSADCA
jgi:O-acetylhomoserine (thiol)-lyase